MKTKSSFENDPLILQARLRLMKKLLTALRISRHTGAVNPRIRRIGLPWLVVCGMALALTGCASGGGGPESNIPTSKAGAISSAMQALGLKKPPPNASALTQDQSIPLHLFTGANLNAGTGDQSLALVVKIYHLRSTQQFQQIPFHAFVDDSQAKSTLGNDLIDSHEMTVLPDQHYDSVESMPGDTRYLGIVALFRTPAEQRWRFIYDVKKSTVSGITVGLHACALSSTAGTLITELSDNAASLASVHCPELPH